MTDDRQERIRLRAHAIWENQGRPHGQDRDHWNQAIREIDAEDAAAKKKKPARATAAKPKAAAKAPAAKKPTAKPKTKAAK